MKHPTPLHPLRARVARMTRLPAALAVAASLSACSTMPAGRGSTALPWTGTVQSIQEGQSSGSWQSMTGSISGAVLGALLGSGIGAGVGQTIASVVTSSAGATGGAKLGSVLGAQPVWNAVIRGSDGVDRVVQVKDKPAFMPGATVSVNADGTVTPR
jgi:outer membrane lipoprotein SlyB